MTQPIMGTDHTHTDLAWKLDALERQVLVLKTDTDMTKSSVDALVNKIETLSAAVNALNTAVEVIRSRILLYPAIAGFAGALVGALVGAGIAAFFAVLILNTQAH